MVCQEQHSYFVPALTNEETPAWHVTVKDNEVGFERYVTAEERRRAEDEERRRQLAAETNKDDAPLRALQEMMGGKMEGKDDLAKLEQVCVVCFPVCRVWRVVCPVSCCGRAAGLCV